MAIDHVDHVRSHCFGVRECDYFILDWTLTTSLLIQTRQTLITAICHICLLLLLFSHYHYTLCNSLLHWILFCVLILHKIRSMIRVSSSFLLQQYEMEVGSSSSSLMPHVLKSVSLFWGEKLHLLPIFFFVWHTKAEYRTLSTQETNLLYPAVAAWNTKLFLLCSTSLCITLPFDVADRFTFGSHHMTHASHYRADVSVPAWWLLVISFREAPVDFRLHRLAILLNLFIYVTSAKHAISFYGCIWNSYASTHEI